MDAADVQLITTDVSNVIVIISSAIFPEAKPSASRTNTSATRQSKTVDSVTRQNPPYVPSAIQDSNSTPFGESANKKDAMPQTASGARTETRPSAKFAMTT